MRILIVGGTGTIGWSVAASLVAAGHDVRGTARSLQAATALRSAGVTPVDGRLEDPDGLEALAREVAAVIVTAQPAFDPTADFVTQMVGSGRIVRSAAEGLLAGLAPGGGMLLWTSGAGAYGDTGDGIATESTPTVDLPFLADLAAAERAALTDPSVRGVVIRPAIVYGAPTGPLVQTAALAALTGALTLVGDGANQLSFVHADDLAALYGLALEASAGTVLNAAEDRFVSQGDLLGAIASTTGVSVMAAPDGADGTYASGILARTMRIGAARARDLGWAPVGAGPVAWVRTPSFAAAVDRQVAAMRVAGGPPNMATPSR